MVRQTIVAVLLIAIYSDVVRGIDGRPSRVVPSRETIEARHEADNSSAVKDKPSAMLRRVSPPRSLEASATSSVGGGNDNCPAASLGILNSAGSDMGTTSGAANNHGAPSCATPCGPNAYGGGGPDVIYSFSVATSGQWTFSLCGGSGTWDSAIQIRAGGACPGSTCIDANDDSCLGCNAPYKAVATPVLNIGNTYYLIIDGFSATSSGAYTLIWSPPSASACDGGIGDCCSQHAQPGCSNENCCETVCACDPFCCQIEWDQACATIGFNGNGCGAGLLCGNLCGGVCENAVGNCCSPHPTPGCGTDSCCEAVCNCDSFCCESEWDEFCATGGFMGNGCGAEVLCGALCDGDVCGDAVGSCCAPHGTPGCNNSSCCESVCSCDPFCCTTEWDEFCATVGYMGNGCGSLLLCPQLCGGDVCDNATGSCCTPHATPGCGSSPCCENVCNCDPFCCTTAWDEFCATFGFEDSGCGAALICQNNCANVCNNATGDCCDAHATPGCSNSDCCEAVCTCDPFCCLTDWDESCATVGSGGDGCGAELLCNQCGPVQSGCCWRCHNGITECSAPVVQVDCSAGWTFTANQNCGTAACGSGQCVGAGACCLSNGNCVEMPQATCANLDGNFHAGFSCEDCACRGDDCFRTECGSAHICFSEPNNTIPSGFFCPTSHAFNGDLILGGLGGQQADTIITRLQDMCFDGLGSQETTQIRLTDLSLQTCEPVQVLFDIEDELLASYWRVTVELSPEQSQLAPGQLSATQTTANGGVFSANYPLQARFTFTCVSGCFGACVGVRVFDTGVLNLTPDEFEIFNAPWTHSLIGGMTGPCGSTGTTFVPGVRDSDPNVGGDECCVRVCAEGERNSSQCVTAAIECNGCASGACCRSNVDPACFVITAQLPAHSAREVCEDMDGVYKGDDSNCVTDADSDGLPDVLEINDCCRNSDDPCSIRTSPSNPDTDGDGCSDGDEVLGGTDPCDPQDPLPVTIQASSPPNNAIDARQPHPINSQVPAQGWNQITLILSGPAACVFANDFIVTVEPPGGPTPSIAEVSINGSMVTLVFDSVTPAGKWTRITHVPSGSSVRIGFLPGDVNNDGVSNPVDILRLVDAMNGIISYQTYQTDIDRSGVANPADILREIDVLNGADAFAPWNGQMLPP